MGACLGSNPNSAKNREVDQDLTKAKNKDKNVKKLLFLGSGGSGKSTLFKQLRTIHGDGWTREERMTFTDHIHAQIIEQMKLAVECIELEANDANDDDNDNKKDPNNTFACLSNNGQRAVPIIQSVKDLKLNAEIAEACKILWSEDKIREIYENRAVTTLEDSSKYFWDKIDEIMRSGFVPSEEDILLVRYRTTGVIEQKFTVKKNIFHIFDVGGQKSERKKWIHCFENVTAVIFVASLSCYDEVMFEDESVNSMVDQLQLFDTICNEHWFEKTSIILFLNKKDLFRNKLEENKPITLCPAFKGYDGDQMSYDDCSAFIKEEFIARNKKPNAYEKSIFVHMTCATDQNNVERVFNDVQSIIIENSLMSAGLVGDFGLDDEPVTANSATGLMAEASY